MSHGLPLRLAGTAFVLWHQRRDRALPWWPLEQTLALQNRRVRAIIRHAYRHVPHYRDAMGCLGVRVEDLATVADLARLPLVTNADLAAAPERFQALSPHRGSCLELTTTGTSGLFKRILHDRRGLLLALAAGARQRAVVARFLGHRGPFRELVFQRPGSTTPLIRAALERLTWVPKRFDLDRLVASPERSLAENVDTLNRFRPEVVSGFSSYVGVLFRWAWENRALQHRPAAITHGGDAMSPADAELIERTLGIPLVASYQACEVLRVAFQCEERAAYHLSLDCVALRVVNDAGEDVAPGESGEVVISNLLDRGTVLLNYRLGDRVRLAAAPCRCGRTLPCLEAIEGRSEDLLITRDGEVVHESVVLPLLYDVPGVHQVQVEQLTPTAAVARVVCAPGADGTVVRDGLDRSLRRLLGGGPAVAVDVEIVERIATTPGGKIRGVISHCRRGMAQPPGAGRPG